MRRLVRRSVRPAMKSEKDVAEPFEKLFSQKRYQDVSLKNILTEKVNGKYQLDLWRANEAIFAWRRDFKGASVDDGHLHLLQSGLSVFSSGEQGKNAEIWRRF